MGVAYPGVVCLGRHICSFIFRTSPMSPLTKDIIIGLRSQPLALVVGNVINQKPSFRKCFLGMGCKLIWHCDLWYVLLTFTSQVRQYWINSNFKAAKGYKANLNAANLLKKVKASFECIGGKWYTGIYCKIVRFGTIYSLVKHNYYLCNNHIICTLDYCTVYIHSY